MMAKMQQMMAMQAAQNTAGASGAEAGCMEGVAQVGMNFNSMMKAICLFFFAYLLGSEI